jgi:hypothetical protein
MDMAWLAILVAVFMFLGLRDRTHGGSTHLTIIVVSCITLAVVFVRLGR